MAKSKMKSIKEAVEGFADTVGHNKDGHIVLRRSFYYTGGYDGAKFASKMIAVLASKGIEAELVREATIWKPFRGGAGVAAGSHFLAVLEVKES